MGRRLEESGIMGSGVARSVRLVSTTSQVTVPARYALSHVRLQALIDAAVGDHAHTLHMLNMAGEADRIATGGKKDVSSSVPSAGPGQCRAMSMVVVDAVVNDVLGNKRVWSDWRPQVVDPTAACQAAVWVLLDLFENECTPAKPASSPRRPPARSPTSTVGERRRGTST